MRAIIPVAGVGSRLRPHTYTIPKVLLNVGGKPILAHILDKLILENITKATFVIGHLGDKIKEFVKNEYSQLDCEFVVQEELGGLGHAIYKAIPTFDDEDIFIILGDTIFDVNLDEVFNKNCSMIGVKEVKDPRRFGVAVIKDGKVEKLVEKPTEPISNLAIVGLYYISNAYALSECLNELIKKDIRTNGELQLTDALQMMIEHGEKICTFPVEGWYDCGKQETMLETNRILLDDKCTNKKFDNVVINNPVYIADDVEISDSIIGPYATISKGTKITESIIKNSIVGENSEIKTSLLENSIIGNNTLIKGSYKRLNTGDSTEIEIH
ncbi:MAG: NTP transferase domain-containing protein [Bacteroidetes bacterium]|nr:NTP transferase domain-containing protein [Bacteroidota bacterium]MCH8941692.1 NTP transferase domain-containing protein [Bacteroidota bacterium]